MNFFIALSIFIFGTIVGSFLNVVILRYDTGRSFQTGRSTCHGCKKILEWFELIPVVSFLIQKAKCRSCGAKLSWQYPIVELATGFLFLASYIHFMNSLFYIGYVVYMLVYFVVISLLIIITVYDFHHKIIPNPFVYSLIIIGFIKLFVTFSPLSFSTPVFWHVLAGPILFSPFALLWFVSGGKWMGFGDAKLAIAIGWLLGLRVGLSAIVLAFWIGAVYSIGLLIIQRVRNKEQKITMKSEVPFGPFLVIGTLLGLFLSIDVLSLNYLVLGF